ncbi:MAG: cytochrome c [Crocinitomicaceae bacterium]
MQIFIFVFSFLFQTNPQVSPLTTEPSNDANQGKSIYEKKCQRCHDLKNINDYSLQQWDVILPKMSKKAMMGKKKRNKVYSYIQWKLAN